MAYALVFWAVAEAAPSIDSGSYLDWLSRAGGTAVLVAVLVLLLRGDLVTRGTHQDVVGQRDRALDLLYRNVEIADQAVGLSQRRLEADEEIHQLRQKRR